MALQLGFMKGSEWRPLEELFGAARKVRFLVKNLQGALEEVESSAAWAPRLAWIFEGLRLAAQDSDADLCGESSATDLTQGFQVVASDGTVVGGGFLVHAFFQRIGDTAFAYKDSESVDGDYQRCEVLDWSQVDADVAGEYKISFISSSDLNGGTVKISNPNVYFFAIIRRSRFSRSEPINANICREGTDFKVDVQMKQQPSGGGGGAMRADNVAEVEYVWAGNKLLGLSLGLDPQFYRDLTNEALDPEIAQGFVYTNVPVMSLSGDLLQTPIGQPDAPNQQWRAGSDILYLKRYKSDARRKNQPRAISFPLAEAKSDDGWPVIAVADMEPLLPRFERLPVHKRSSDDAMPRKKRKGQRLAGGGTTGVALANRGGDRASAAQVMGISATRYAQALLDQIPQIAPLSDAEVKAFDYETGAGALNILDQAPYVRQSWVSSMAGPSAYDQEWCHLVGHGDGGPEEVSNFVCGSKHCNTEQLAIESGHRKGGIDKLKVKVTAYLVHANTHLARLVRYKIYAPVKKADAKDVEYTKIFDHLFDAQSKSFNYHEYKILKATVERIVSVANPHDCDVKYYSGAAYAQRVNEDLKVEIGANHGLGAYQFGGINSELNRGFVTEFLRSAAKKQARKFIKTKARAPAAASSAPASAPAASGSASGAPAASGASGASASAPAAPPSGDVPMSGADSS